MIGVEPIASGICEQQLQEETVGVRFLPFLLVIVARAIYRDTICLFLSEEPLIYVTARQATGAITQAPVCPEYSSVIGTPPTTTCSLNREPASCRVAMVACMLRIVVVTAPR